MPPLVSLFWHVAIAALPIALIAVAARLRHRIHRLLESQLREQPGRSILLRVYWAGLPGGVRLNRAVFLGATAALVGLALLAVLAGPGFNAGVVLSVVPAMLLLVYLLAVATRGPHDLFVADQGLFWRGLRHWAQVRGYRWQRADCQGSLLLSLDSIRKQRPSRTTELMLPNLSPSDRASVDRLLQAHLGA